MNWTDICSIVFGGVGLVASVIAVFQTCKANKLAKDANALAKEANERAGNSNALAAKANEISNNANAISQRALSVTADQTEYNWAAEFDYETSSLTIWNDCALFADDVAIVIRNEDETVVESREQRISAFNKVILQSDFFREEILKQAVGYSRSGIYGAPYFRVEINVVWTSELGMRRTKIVKQGFGKTKRKKSL
jgi:hypothetical protein